jgi:hypothetical protein
VVSMDFSDTWINTTCAGNSKYKKVPLVPENLYHQKQFICEVIRSGLDFLGRE